MRAHALSIALLAAACATVAPPAGPAPVPLAQLAANIESYRGRTVRVCGSELTPITQPNGTVRTWQLRQVDPTSPHRFTAYVIVPGCNGARPRLVRGCITGRIAREDGSLNVPEHVTIGSHLIGSQEWWLHPQCSVRGG